MTDRVKVGIIGTGLMGALHARNLAQTLRHSELVAIADADLSRAKALADELGTRASVDGFAVIADPNVDALVIASPDGTHADYVLAAIAADKPVMCEKPVATTGADAIRVIEAESEKGRRMVQVGFMREFDPEHLGVRTAIDEGRIGNPVMFRAIHINPTIGTFRMSPDAVITSSIIHDIHSARWLMGQEIDTVFVKSIAHDAGNPDTCKLLTISCTFVNGALGLMDVNIEASYGYAVSAEVVGSAGTVTTAQPRSTVVLKDFGRHEEIAGGFGPRFGSAYLAELDAWLRSVQSGTPVGPSAWDGYASLAVADACSESLHTNKAVKVALRDRFGIYA
jgi:myo-inositol 2-dehydrogenase/D-chiro-inositol 1-dehydrogenase